MFLIHITPQLLAIDQAITALWCNYELIKNFRSSFVCIVTYLELLLLDYLNGTLIIGEKKLPFLIYDVAVVCKLTEPMIVSNNFSES